MELIESRDTERRPLPGHRPAGREYADTANLGMWFIALLMLGGTVVAVLAAVGVMATSSRTGVWPLTLMFAALTVWLWAVLVWLRLDARTDARRRDTVDPDYRDFRWTPGGFVAPGPRPVNWALTMLAWTVALVMSTGCSRSGSIIRGWTSPRITRCRCMPSLHAAGSRNDQRWRMTTGTSPSSQARSSAGSRRR